MYLRSRLQNIKQTFAIESYVWDATGLVITITSHKFINGAIAFVPNVHASYDSVTGVVQYINANSFRVVSAPVLGEFKEVVTNCYFTGQTGPQTVQSIRKGEGSETVVQSWIKGTGGATFDVEFSMNGTHWIKGATVTLTTADNDTGGFTFTAGWAYVRLNITSIGASSMVYVMLGD